MPFTLTLLDTTGIQDYIFASNRLQENIGASELVHRATSLFAFKALADTVGGDHNILLEADGLTWSYGPRRIEADPALRAEVLQAAGGNFVTLFRVNDDAVAFVRALTLRLLSDAPGLTVLAQHDTQFDFTRSNLAESKRALEKAMQTHKRTRVQSTPTLGLGVSAVCTSTGLPAVTTLAGGRIVEGKYEPYGLEGEDISERISAQTAAKRAWRGQANRRMDYELRNAAAGFTFPFDLEKIGRDLGEESYLAVVHADGNRMSEHVAQVLKDAKDNRERIERLRAFSNDIEAISLDALRTVVKLVVEAVKEGAIPSVSENGRRYLPFRPLVFGGDDVTFVCNGKIGVSVAAEYLKAFEAEAQKRGRGDLHACAGVSIVKLHYPFARAYALSEELTGSAKKLTREVDCSALDWHFAQSGLIGGLEEIRDREFQDDKGRSLSLRPLTLSVGSESWKSTANILKNFSSDYWYERHNKVVGLREALRSDSVTKYRRDFGLKELPPIPDVPAEETGWHNDRCYYFDAVEILDHYVPLH